MINRIKELLNKMAYCDKCMLNDHHMEHIREIENTLDTRKITISKEELDNNQGGGGLEIRIPGFKNNPAAINDGQIFIEFYQGKISVHVWYGEQDPVTTVIEKEDANLNHK